MDACTEHANNDNAEQILQLEAEAKRRKEEKLEEQLKLEAEQQLAEEEGDCPMPCTPGLRHGPTVT